MIRPSSRSEHAEGRLNEGRLTQRHRHRPGQPRYDHPAGQGQDQDQVLEPRTSRVQDERQQQARKAHLDVDQSHQQVVNPAADQPGQQAKHHPTVTETITVATPTLSEMRAPKTMRDTMSRPS